MKSCIKKAYQVTFVFSCFVAFLWFWQGAFLVNSSALALPHTDSFTASVHTLVSYGHETQEPLDRVAGSGTSDRLEGKAEQAAGAVQRQVGKVTGQTEGTSKQIEGQAKEGLGQAKATAEQARSQAEDATKSFVDRVKDFFD